MPRFDSIRFRITAVAVVTSTAVVVGFGWLFIELVTSRLVATGEQELLDLADEVDGFALVDLGDSGARYQIADGDYLLVLDLDDDDDLLVNIHPGNEPEADSLGAFVIDTGTGDIRRLIVVPDGLSRPELEGLSIDGAETIRGLSDDLLGDRADLVELTEEVFDEIDAGVGAARSAAVAVGPLLVLASGLTTWLLVGRALAPTRRIAEEAAAIDTTTLNLRVTRRGRDDEVDTIARVINEMLDRIESGVQREQQFVADASHELRTPLATARIAAELAAADVADSPYPPQVLDEVDRMERLVDDLLRLARHREPAISDPVALDVVVAEAVDQHPAVDMIRSSAGPAVSVLGDEAELSRMVRNLLGNAARHARSTVDVSLTIEGERAVLRVDDDGDGVAPAERARIFDRFVRLDEGRARDEGGSGLGLAIVLATVQRHRGRIRVDDSPGGGARFELDLPLLDPPLLG